MKRFDKIAVINMVYLILCLVSYCFSFKSSFWDSFYFIREHLFVIFILLFIKDYVNSSFACLLIYGICLYKLELILYNIALIFIPYASRSSINIIYDIVMILTGTIFFIVIFAKYFDKICIFFNRIHKWIKQ